MCAAAANPATHKRREKKQPNCIISETNAADYEILRSKAAPARLEAAHRRPDDRTDDGRTVGQKAVRLPGNARQLTTTM